MLLHQAGSAVSMHQLAEAQSITPSSATQLVDRLVRIGLVERLREDEDRRLVACSSPRRPARDSRR